jgi:glycosyltransferase involved in cell wall biosynthesis
MRIALITDGLHPYVMGGMQRHSTMLAQHLPAHGVELFMFHTAHSESAIAAARALDGFPLIAKSKIKHVLVVYPERGRLPGHYVVDNFRYSRRVLEAYLQLNQQFDFIYAKGLTGHAFVEAKKEGMALPPIGMKAHGYEMFQRAANLRVKLEHLLLRPSFAKLTRDSDFVFSYGGKISEILRERLQVAEERIIEIPTGIDPLWLLDSVRPALANKRRFIFLGRYERRKGIEELHAVLSEWTGPEIEFVFIGPIPKEKQLNLPWVQYRGSVSDQVALKAELDQGDVLVCPSYSEGMPNVIMEAMARGLAIIATDVGAVASVVDATNGILVERLSIKALKSAILRVSCILDGELSMMKSASLERVSNYTWGRVSSDVAENIRSAVSS